MRKKAIFIALVALLAIVPNMSAQKYKWSHYYMEAGLFGGGSFYLGDANEKLFKGTRPAAGLFAKYKFNGYWELKLQGTVGQAKIGEFENEGDRITTFGDLALMAEFNFFNFGAMSLEPNASRVSPYIFVGVGGAYFNDGVAPILPFGLGVKWSVTNRLNLGMFWSMQKTLWNDNFDLIDNPLNQEQGMWNNNDWYSTAGIYISFNFWEICPNCKDGRKNYFYYGY